jgi:hypothetical protein
VVELTLSRLLYIHNVHMHTYCEPATETNNPKTVTREFKKNVCFSTEDNKKFFYVYCGYKRNRSCTYCCQSASDGKEIEKKRTVDVRRRVHSRERSVAGGRAAPPARRRPEGGERERIHLSFQVSWPVAACVLFYF